MKFGKKISDLSDFPTGCYNAIHKYKVDVITIMLSCRLTEPEYLWVRY